MRPSPAAAIAFPFNRPSLRPAALEAASIPQRGAAHREAGRSAPASSPATRTRGRTGRGTRAEAAERDVRRKQDDRAHVGEGEEDEPHAAGGDAAPPRDPAPARPLLTLCVRIAVALSIRASCGISTCCVGSSSSPSLRGLGRPASGARHVPQLRPRVPRPVRPEFALPAGRRRRAPRLPVRRPPLGDRCRLQRRRRRDGRLNGNAIAAAGERTHAGPWAWSAWLLGGLAAAAGWLALRSFSPAGDGHSICLMRDIAHVACPTCGMTRALALLAQGRWGASLALHPLAAPLAAQGAAAWILWGHGLARRSWRLADRWLPASSPPTRPPCSRSG